MEVTREIRKISALMMEQTWEMGRHMNRNVILKSEF
jgi:hypothetical protein